MDIRDVIRQRIEALRQIEADLLAQVYAVQGAIAEYENNLLPSMAKDGIPIQEFAQMIGGPGATAGEPEVIDET